MTLAAIAPVPQADTRKSSRLAAAVQPSITRKAATNLATRLARQMIFSFRSPARLGRLGEDYTTALLISHGWRILARNFRTRYGEIDIIALTPAKMIVVVEVKARASLATGLPALAVTTAKQHRLRLAAQQWLHDNPTGGRPLRFDVSSLIVHSGKVLLDYREGAF